MATEPRSDLSQPTTESRMGKVSGAEEMRATEVSWREMPGAVNCAYGCNDFRSEASLPVERKCRCGH
jgi:hypothetical protein